jgi:integrase
VNDFIDRLKQDNYISPRVLKGTPIEAWIKRFLAIETSPRATRLVAKNRGYSPQTIGGYASIFENHLKGDPFLDGTMETATSGEVMELFKRIAGHRIPIGRPHKDKDGVWIQPDLSRPVAGTRQYEAIYSFVRMTFREYQLTHTHFYDPFVELERPKPTRRQERQGLEEDEVVKLFTVEGVFRDEPELERAVCAAMFWAGLRRSEIFGLMPGDLDWSTPKIIVRNAWKNFDRKTRELGDPKHHKIRETIFPDILQEAIKAHWEKNGHHELVFARKDGTIPGAAWFESHTYKWLDHAGIDLAGRTITPHSARHSLASVLENNGESLRVIGDLLGHSDLKTTKGYLHTPQGKINEITKKINESQVDKGTSPVANVNKKDQGSAGDPATSRR